MGSSLVALQMIQNNGVKSIKLGARSLPGALVLQALGIVLIHFSYHARGMTEEEVFSLRAQTATALADIRRRAWSAEGETPKTARSADSFPQRPEFLPAALEDQEDETAERENEETEVNIRIG